MLSVQMEQISCCMLPFRFEKKNRSHDCLVCLSRLYYREEALESPSEIGIVLLEPFLTDNEETGLDLLEADFLDDDYVVIVYRNRGEDS